MSVTHVERSPYYVRKKTFAFSRMVGRAPADLRRNTFTSHSQTSAGLPQQDICGLSVAESPGPPGGEFARVRFSRV